MFVHTVYPLSLSLSLCMSMPFFCYENEGATSLFAWRKKISSLSFDMRMNRWDFNSIYHHCLQTRDFDDDEDDFNMADDNDGEHPKFTIYFFDFALQYLFYYDFSIKCFSTLQMSPCFSWSTGLIDIWWLEFCRYRKIHLYFYYKNVHYMLLHLGYFCLSLPFGCSVIRGLHYVFPLSILFFYHVT